MRMLKKRSTAVVVLVIVVVLFSWIGCRRSLGKACRETEAAFFDRSLLQEEGAYSCPADHLENCVDLSNRLLSVLGQDEAWEEVRLSLQQARRALADALQAKDIPAAGQALEALSGAVAQAEETRSMGVPLAESYDDADAILGEFHAAAQAARDDAYARHVAAFEEKVLRAFPTRFLLPLTGVRAPATFPEA